VSAGASSRIAHRVAAADEEGERRGETKMKTGEQREAIPMRQRQKNGDAGSLWNEAEWKHMQEARNKVPTTLQEALLAGYLFDADKEERCNAGGILGEEFLEGSFILRTEYRKAPDLVLPYRARLEFGRVHLREKSEQEGESK
jgi:hypothetical protein